MKLNDSAYAFSQIPPTLLTLFNIGTGGLPSDCIRSGNYQRVIVILVDGFGWKFLQQYASKYPFLKRFFDQGIVSKISSQFPSTTAAHITTLCSGLPVGEHGIYEWFIYEPLVDRIIAPLLYSFARDRKPGVLEKELSPQQLLPYPLFFQTLQHHQIPTSIFQHESIAQTTYSQWMYQGTERLGYNSWENGLVLLTEKLKKPGFFYLYFGDFDSEAHRRGLQSLQVQNALDHCFHALETILMAAPEMSHPSTALILTADHGMIAIDPANTLYLNQMFPNLEQQLQKGADGYPLVPAGSCRDFFLHIKPSLLLEVQAQLVPRLQEIATVHLTSDLIEGNFFGITPISEVYKKRMGNLVIIPKGNHSIWWYEKGRFEQNFQAMHGGLTPDELETIFLFFAP